MVVVTATVSVGAPEGIPAATHVAAVTAAAGGSDHANPSEGGTPPVTVVEGVLATDGGIPVKDAEVLVTVVAALATGAEAVRETGEGAPGNAVVALVIVPRMAVPLPRRVVSEVRGPLLPLLGRAGATRTLPDVVTTKRNTDKLARALTSISRTRTLSWRRTVPISVYRKLARRLTREARDADDS